MHGRTLALAPLLIVLVQQPQCDVGAMVSGQAVEGAREYFPNAQVLTVLPCVLSIETGVQGVSKKLLIEIAHRVFSPQEINKLVLGMDLAGYKFFILGFGTHTIVFDRFGGRYFVFDSYENAAFFQSLVSPCVPFHRPRP